VLPCGVRIWIQNAAAEEKTAPAAPPQRKHHVIAGRSNFEIFIIDKRIIIQGNDRSTGQ
jgi:hypothetical protein